MWVGLQGEGGYATGGHRIEGIFIASGRDIASCQWVDPISIIDIAPTILHIMEVPVPSDIDGSVLFPIFKKGSSPASRSVNISPPLVPRTQPENPSPLHHLEDDEKVLKRLRDLGYLE
jgi:arylsulfatase A-like enzyme